MSLDFLSGLLLSLTALAVVGYIIIALVGGQGRDLTTFRHDVSDALKRVVATDAKPINDHLIGAAGDVVAHSKDPARPMRVRVNFELWSARLASTQGDPPAIGTSVKVAAVDGQDLVVEVNADATSGMAGG
jgi:membrane protein implicated in regulation of membrane protease activity